jgi:hypothetical protein
MPVRRPVRSGDLEPARDPGRGTLLTVVGPRDRVVSTRHTVDSSGVHRTEGGLVVSVMNLLHELINPRGWLISRRVGAAIALSSGLLGAGLVLTTARSSAANNAATWQQWHHQVGIVDLAGPRTDGTLIAVAAGRLSILSPDGALAPFATGPDGSSWGRSTVSHTRPLHHKRPRREPTARSTRTTPSRSTSTHRLA